MVSTPDEVTYDSLHVTMTSTPVKKPSASKSLCLFTIILDVKPKRAKCCFVAEKFKLKSMKLTY